MSRGLQRGFGMMAALLCGLCLPGAALGQNLPDDTGKAEFIHNCLDCHSAGMVLRARKTPEEWRKNVDDMVARGSDGSKEDIEKVVVYLDKYFATDKSGAAAAAAQAAMPLPSPESERGRRVAAANGCLACHRIEKQGSYSGPGLNGIKSRRTVDEIRAAILHAKPMPDAGNNLLQVTSVDGTVHVGRVLSQNEHDVRIIDASGQAATYSKAELHGITNVPANPMPSYEGKIAGDDLQGLVRYLGSLPALDDGGSK